MNAKGGQGTLSMVLIVGAIIVMMAMGVAFVIVTFVNSSYGFQASTRAQMVASAGVQDVVLQLMRNKDYLPSPNPYNVTVGNDTASVTVTQNSPSAGSVRVVSTATVAGFTKSLQVYVSVSTSTGQIATLTWTQQ